MLPRASLLSRHHRTRTEHTNAGPASNLGCRVWYVEFCISIHRCDVPKFRVLSGGEAVFLQLLEPFIVTGRLGTLAAPVLQCVARCDCSACSVCVVGVFVSFLLLVACDVMSLGCRFISLSSTFNVHCLLFDR